NEALAAARREVKKITEEAEDARREAQALTERLRNQSLNAGTPPDAAPNPPEAAPADAETDSPLHAESLYVEGVRQFWAGDYARAEERFVDAVRNDGRDARYHYYLGLSRRAQGKRVAAQRDFERGAELERQERPGRSAINAALE